jgi:hypothetical protein
MLDFCGRYAFRAWAEADLLVECMRRLSQHTDPVLSNAALRWFPTDGDLLSQLEVIAAGEEGRHNGATWFWAQRFVERSDDIGRMSALLERWLGEGLSAKKFKLAALAIGYQGGRADLSMLRRFLETNPDESLNELYQDAEYRVRRRSFI